MRQQPTVRFARGSDVAIEGVIQTNDRPALAGALKSFEDLPLVWRTGKGVEFAVVGHLKARDLTGDDTWVKAQLAKSSAYFETLKELVAKGKLVLSDRALVDRFTAGKSASATGLKGHGIILEPSQHTMALRHFLVNSTRLLVLQSREKESL
jgi:hypothetical protein